MSIEQGSVLTELATKLKQGNLDAVDMILTVNDMAKEITDSVVAQAATLNPEMQMIVLGVVIRRLQGMDQQAIKQVIKSSSDKVSVHTLLLGGWSRIHAADGAIWVHPKATCPVTFAEAVCLYGEGIKYG